MTAKHRDDRTPFYALPCACGGSLQVSPAQAGELFACPACGHTVAVPPLSMLRGQEPCGYAAGTGKSPFQFTLAQLMGAVTLWAVALSIGKTIGFSIVVPKLLQLALFALLITFPVLVVAAMRRASWLFWDVVRHRDKGDED